MRIASAVDRRPFASAESAAVWPSFAAALVAPASKRRSTTGLKAARPAAKCRAVRPSSQTAGTSHPSSTSVQQRRMAELRSSHCSRQMTSGVLFRASAVRESTCAPAFTRSLQTATSPARAAWCSALQPLESVAAIRVPASPRTRRTPEKFGGLAAASSPSSARAAPRRPSRRRRVAVTKSGSAMSPDARTSSIARATHPASSSTSPTMALYAETTQARTDDATGGMRRSMAIWLRSADGSPSVTAFAIFRTAWSRGLRRFRASVSSGFELLETFPTMKATAQKHLESKSANDPGMLVSLRNSKERSSIASSPSANSRARNSRSSIVFRCASSATACRFVALRAWRSSLEKTFFDESDESLRLAFAAAAVSLEPMSAMRC
mmetsp:Transcript_14405/g.50117  ORF Transcript_14405/g.50117 Transcript_14405/m.50117 type:complete len:380 (-) Transcript_14405:575-1714(-)